MAPLGGEPGVVEIEPADHRADIERRVHRLKLPIGAGNARAVRQGRAGDHRAQMFRAFGIAQREQAAAEGIHEIIARGIDGFATVGDIIRRIIRDVDENFVRFGTNIRNLSLMVAWKEFKSSRFKSSRLGMRH